MRYARRFFALISLMVSGTSVYGQLGAINAADTNPSVSRVVVITPHGFVPSSLYVPTGAFALLIQNRSQVQTLNVNLTLDGLATVLLASAHTPRLFDARHVINPAPGTYRLTVQEHPSWTFTLNVTPKQ